MSVRENGGQGDGEMGRWGDGEMGGQLPIRNTLPYGTPCGEREHLR
ncbi:hypothetical protein [Rivularia sp. UHCC 0363]|nr:hypothetical protein [Rivularia sp. UHCC 0363]MEA5594539.1 hypothetical protein [Rivularia sp. UHCC 0363]